MSYYGQSYPNPRYGPAFSPEQDVSQLDDQLCHNKTQISQTQQQIQDIVRKRSESRASGVLRSPEIDEKDRHIFQLQRKLEHQEAELEKYQQEILQQRQRILQQKATIKHQSDTIQNPRPNNAFATPHRRQENKIIAPSHVGTCQPPPIFDLSGTNSRDCSTPPRPLHVSSNQYNDLPAGQAQLGPPPYTALQHDVPFPPSGGGHYPTHVPPTVARVPRHANEYGSPEPLRPPPRYNHSRGTSVASPFNPTPPSRGPQSLTSSPDQVSPPVSVQEVTKKLSHVFSMTEQYAFSHVNVPSTVGDRALPMAIKDHLMRAASKDSANFIMSNAQTRYFLVAKVINEWVIKHVLTVTVYNQFSPEVGNAIDSSKNQIYQSTPLAVRYFLQSTIANEIRKVQAQPNFPSFLNSLCRDRGNLLWAIIKPLMHKKTTKDWDDLLLLMQEAHKLADLMFAGAEEYRFDFPNIGDQFTSSTMNNRDPFMRDVSQQDLHSRGVIVRLGFAPTVRYRSNGPQGTNSSGTLRNADVLVKWRD